jgi:ABC-type transport system substrate-binding protein
MKSAVVAGIALILAVAGLGAGYGIGNSTSHTLTATSTATSTVTVTNSSIPWTVVVQNGTFTGPGCPSRPAQVFMALRIPCLHYTNSSTWYASLLKYNGKDFYSTTETVALINSSISTTYTVWFDNSTEYCVSPYLSVSELPTCPPP